MSMFTDFINQLILSFIVGGFLVGLQAMYAEKASKEMAGLILTFPSTAIVSFFFMWRVLDVGSFKKALISAPITMGVSLLFVYVYIKSFQIFSKFTLRKLTQIFLAILTSLLFWTICAILVLKSQIVNIWLSLLIAIFAIFITKVLFAKEELCTKPLPNIQYSFLQKFLRMLFSGFVISVAVFFAKTMGPIWGGLFSMFPAAYISSLLTYSPNYNHRFMYRAYHNAPIGTIGLLIFTLSALWLFPMFGNLIGSLISILLSFLYSLIVYLLAKRD